jgi:hypothetical protein
MESPGSDNNLTQKFQNESLTQVLSLSRSMISYNHKLRNVHFNPTKNQQSTDPNQQYFTRFNYSHQQQPSNYSYYPQYAHYGHPQVSHMNYSQY